MRRHRKTLTYLLAYLQNTNNTISSRSTNCIATERHRRERVPITGSEQAVTLQFVIMTLTTTTTTTILLSWLRCWRSQLFQTMPIMTLCYCLPPISSTYSSSFPGFFSFLEIISVSVYIQTTTTIVITRCKAKPVGSPPAYPPRRLLIMLLIGLGSPASIESGNGLPAPSIATALLVVRRRRRPSECHANYKAWNRSNLPTKLVATATSLEGSKI